MLKTTKNCTKPINFNVITTIFGNINVFFPSKIWSCEFLFANLPTFKPAVAISNELLAVSQPLKIE